MKNDVIIVGLLALLIGLFIGYVLAPRGVMNPGGMYGMHGQMGSMMGEHIEDEQLQSDGFMGHAMDEMMRGLRGKHGEEYEQAFLEMMIVHHEGAINMAEELLMETERPELVGMANDIIEVQSQEIEMMEEWHSDWFNQ